MIEINRCQHSILLQKLVLGVPSLSLTRPDKSPKPNTILAEQRRAFVGKSLSLVSMLTTVPIIMRVNNIRGLRRSRNVRYDIESGHIRRGSWYYFNSADYSDGQGLAKKGVECRVIVPISWYPYTKGKKSETLYQY